jgi:hypothetical protein
MRELAGLAGDARRAVAGPCGRAAAGHRLAASLAPGADIQPGSMAGLRIDAVACDRRPECYARPART